MTDGLVEFLRARLDKDEQVARAADDGYFAAGLFGTSGSDAEFDHIARWDPARVLAEVEAKRRIVDGYGEDDCVRLLALPYAGHPDYRAEWSL